MEKQKQKSRQQRHGPLPRYGKRKGIHVQVAVTDLEYIGSVTANRTQWVNEAIQEKRQREEGVIQR